MTLAAGTRLGPYEIVAPIGAGGMGEVYRARDTRLGRDVAIKVLPADLAASPERRRRFEQEARAVAALSHPNIVALYDVGTHDGIPYLVSELLEGETLTDALRGGPLSVGKSIDLGILITKGLAAAHARGMVHRDLKPSNVFLTRDGQVKLLDFGIAKVSEPQTTPTDEAPTVTSREGTEEGTRLGTVGYMAPEQVRGLPCDQRADIFAFGCVLYEMLSGRRAFKGATAMDTLSAVLKETPPALMDLRESVSPALQQIVDRCLEKRPEDRFSSAHDLALALAAVSTGSAPLRTDAAAPRNQATATPGAVVTDAAVLPVSALRRFSASVRAHRWQWLLGSVALVLVVVAAYPIVVRERQRSWARGQLPELMRLADAHDYWKAFLLARRIEAVLPGDPVVQNVRPRFTGAIAREIRPVGAKVMARPRAGGDADWVELGKAEGKPLSAPLGYSVFKIEYPGFESREFAMSVSEFGFDSLRFTGAIVLSRPGEVPEGMVRVEVPTDKTNVFLNSDSASFAPEPHVGTFFVDAHEVTNREFKRFVDQGGYRQRDLWTQPFKRDGRELPFDEAMALFRDTTGQPGPAGWSVGSYEQGADELPVTGVSWYEAAAYAAFVGKRLPSVYHWALASAFTLGGGFVQMSNFSGKLAPVGSFLGSLNYWGLYDAAGNAREWCTNASGNQRFAVGGAADSGAYMFWRVETFFSPFDRNPMTGFRCVKTVTPDPREALLDAPVEGKTPPDWEKVKGFSDDVWRTWQVLFPHATSPLAERIERTDVLPAGTMEKVSFNAGYPNERVVAYLFLPDRKRYPPPWQAVVFWTAGFAYEFSSSEDGRNTHDASYWSYLVSLGRVVVYPIVKGTFERGGGTGVQEPLTPPELVFDAKDIFRTIDYLGTRKDIRKDRIGYLGFSLGAVAGPLVCATEPRIRAQVLLGGLIVDRDVAGFVRRCSIPTLLVNGRDPNATGDRESALFKVLGTPDSMKDQRVLDTDHSLAGALKQVTGLTVEWFDKHLGPVR